MVRSARNVLIAALAVTIFAVVAILVLWVALWLAVVAAVILGIAVLHLFVLPRLATRVRLSTQVVTVLLAPPLVAIGWLIARHPLGGLAGLAVWAGALALPRFALGSAGNRTSWKIEFRAGEPRTPRGGSELTAGRACGRCQMILHPPPNGGTVKCPRCGTEQTRRDFRTV